MAAVNFPRRGQRTGSVLVRHLRLVQHEPSSWASQRTTRFVVSQAPRLTPNQFVKAALGAPSTHDATNGVARHDQAELRNLTYSITWVMTPAPTVRPPSRIAKREPFSNATGVIN